MFTPARSRTRTRRLLPTLALTGAVALAAAACSTAPTAAPTGSAPASGHAGMSGMHDTATGDGLAAESSGFRFAPVASTLPVEQPGSFQFRILAADGTAVTAFETDQTKLMHFYLVRSDLTGFQHVHPAMSADGTWTAPLDAARPGSYRAYTSFIVTDSSGAPVPLVLGQQLTVPGTPALTPLPAPSVTTQVDGYTLTVAGDQLMAGTQHPLTVTVTRDGQPVTDLQPYLDTYAHLTALHEGDLAFAHLHPNGIANGDRGGPALSFTAELPTAGQWRLFLQFQTAGVVHTAAVTISAG